MRQRLILITLICLTFGLCATGLASADTWWHLATGRWILAHRAIPFADPFSFTAGGRPWIAHEYLAEIGMFALYRVAGFSGLVVANSALLTLAFWFVYRRSTPPRARAARGGGPVCRGARAANACALLLGAWAARPGLALRPQTFTLLLAAIYLWLLDRYARDSAPFVPERKFHQLRWLALLPLLMLFWVQLHGGFIAGILLIVLTGIAETLDWIVKRNTTPIGIWWPLLPVLLLCVAVVPLNPNGSALYRFPFYLMSMRVNRAILEWQPPVLSDARIIPFLLLLGLTLLALMFSARKYRPGQYLWLAVFTYAALTSRRNIPLFAVVAAPLLAEHARMPKLDGLSRIPRRLATAVALGVALAALGFGAYRTLLAIRSQEIAEVQAFPASAVRYLQQQNLPGNLLNSYAFGGYLIWRAPERKVLVDGRADLYGDAFLDQYISVYLGQVGPDAFLDRYRVHTAILEPGSKLAALLAMKSVRGPWKAVYRDELAVIYVRPETP